MLCQGAGRRRVLLKSQAEDEDGGSAASHGSGLRRGEHRGGEMGLGGLPRQDRSCLKPFQRTGKRSETAGMLASGEIRGGVGNGSKG